MKWPHVRTTLPASLFQMCHQGCYHTTAPVHKVTIETVLLEKVTSETSSQWPFWLQLVLALLMKATVILFDCRTQLILFVLSFLWQFMPAIVGTQDSMCQCVPVDGIMGNSVYTSDWHCG